MKNIVLLICLLFIFHNIHAQICGSPGKDGATGFRNRVINTYFSPATDMVLPQGSKQIMLNGVDLSGGLFFDNFGTTPISPGDLLMVIQMQDATINFSDDARYGSNNPLSGPDGRGGTGFTDLGSSGKYEYVLAINSVTRNGGLLIFKGLGAGDGTVNQYISAAPTLFRGSRSFQVIRVPQYANLTLDLDRESVNMPRFNGKVGGVLAFNVAGTLNLNGHKIDASVSGFFGGDKARGFERADGYYNRNDVYAQFSTRDLAERHAGKADGVAGSPAFGFPLGTRGIGAAANAGGAGYLNLAGGGGGGNGGAGGVGGNGAATGDPRDVFPNGGRPGSPVYTVNADLDRLIPGGGGGGADVNGYDIFNITAAGGAAVMINADRITGTGAIISNGASILAPWANPGDYNVILSGSGGGAGGTIFVNELRGDLPANVSIEARGGNGHNIALKNSVMLTNGPGGGGGGGQVFNSLSPSRASTNVTKGSAGMVYETGDKKSAADGQDGNTQSFRNSDLPRHLRYNVCFPELYTKVALSNLTALNYPGSQLNYTIRTRNLGPATAVDVQLEMKLPPGFSFVSAKASYTGDSSGPETLVNLDPTARRLLVGNFNLFPGDEVVITLTAKIACNVIPGTYHASAQSLAPDPLRTAANPDRLVTPAVNAFPNTFFSYESYPDPVPGSNYNGDLAASSAEDVVVVMANITGNVIQAPQISVFCLKGDPGIIQGMEPSGGPVPFSYQWQQSSNGQDFTNIIGAITEHFDPPLLTESVYYRRKVVMGGCIDVPNFSNIVLMKVEQSLPVPGFLMPDACVNDGATYFKNTTVPDDDDALGILTYVWDFGDVYSGPGNPNTSTDKNGRHLFSRSGEYTITLTVSRAGICPQTITRGFRFNGLPTANFSIQGSTYCSGQELAFEDRATVDYGEITRIEWYFDDQKPTEVQVDLQPEKRNAGVRIFKHLYPAFHSPATRTVSVRMVVFSGTSCRDEKLMSFILQASPELTFDALPAICKNADPFQLTQAKEVRGTAGEGKYLGRGVNAQGEFSPELAGPGTYSIQYIFTAENGCVVEKSQQITVLPVPVADAGADISMLEGGSQQLALDSKVPAGGGNSGLRYKWTPATFLDRDDVRNPVCAPTLDQVYTLTVTDGESCASTDQVNVRLIKNPQIPNTFSPNGDGINDDWKIKYMESYPQATIVIFNRFGTKVFSGDAKSKPWDGKFKGKDLPIGTYFYVIDPHNGRKTLSGSITILR
ncbi:hypothetical protein AQ505_17555 [Pedobacter sp. PACM 27299]|uniref:T9SS type B sorting domain-containing protein n=1 Tax=Pedobacter sp. PACM 27299 TaxID=1727164 RepID=UPI000705E30F|nr:gliding motility-associated C-terminal domain-containing protein [Pedobacter sp. PACM 27299]ALL07133.1 hypothetical protein AQ505_17555 [Pedobacter sp. PACM 27299]